MTDRSNELKQHIEAEQQRLEIGKQARKGTTEAALAALDEWDLRQYQEMGPPDVERAQELYRDGEVNEQELEVLVEAAMQYYPPDGVRDRGESKLLTENTSEAGLVSKFAAVILSGLVLAFLLFTAANPPI